jgi:molybdopterin molybdotransferase
MMPSSLLPVDEALDRIITAMTPTGDDSLSLTATPMADLLNRVLAAPVLARLSHPPCAVSAMDGYAAAAADMASLPAAITLIGESAAGHPFDGAVKSGGGVRIFTGAPCPQGTEVIIPQEDAHHDGDKITITAAPPRGKYIRKKGSDFSKGDLIAEAGQRLGGRMISLIVAAGHGQVMVKKKPRIAVILTGDELVPPGVLPGSLPGISPDSHQIVSSNGVLLSALLTAFGGEILPPQIIPDDDDQLKAVMGDLTHQNVKPDLIVTSGGASVGAHDGIAKMMTEGGHDLDFWQIAMRPGKPLIFGHVDGTPLLGLPGNPVSTGVCAMVFVAAAIRAMLGEDFDKNPPLPLEDAVLSTPVKANDRRQDFLRTRLSRMADGRLQAAPFSQQDSSMLSLFSQADGFVVRPPHAEAAEAGTAVKVMVIPAFV